VNTAITREGLLITTSVMGKELLTFIDNVDYIRIITITFKDKKRKLTYGTNNRLFVNLNLNNANALSEHIQINVFVCQNVMSGRHEGRYQ